MATRSESDFVKKHGPYDGKVILETGAAHGHSAKLRKDLVCEKYIGTDMQEAGTVDLVHDLHDPFTIDKVDVVFCFSVLEHCKYAWSAAINIENVLKPGGLILLSVPFQWRVHAYPDDYYRFTLNGIKTVFENIEFFLETFDPPNTNLTTHTNGHVLILAAGRRK